jgi:hypothetical protein
VTADNLPQVCALCGHVIGSVEDDPADAVAWPWKDGQVICCWCEMDAQSYTESVLKD